METLCSWGPTPFRGDLCLAESAILLSCWEMSLLSRKISRQRLGSKERLSGKYKEARTTSFTAMTRLEAKPWPTARRWGLPLFAQAPLVLPPLFQALFSPAQRTSVVRQRPERTWYSHPMLVVHLVDEAPRTAKTTGEVLQGLLATDISYHIYRQPADVVLDLNAPASHDLFAVALRRLSTRTWLACCWWPSNEVDDVWVKWCPCRLF